MGERSESLHTRFVDELAQSLRTDTKNGLRAADAQERLRQSGSNEIEAKSARSRLSILVASVG
jgi:hypothetical protein